MTRRLLSALALSFAALLLAPAPGLAQAPSSPNARARCARPADATTSNLMLLGHDAVAYFTENDSRASGDPAIKALNTRA